MKKIHYSVDNEPMWDIIDIEFSDGRGMMI